MGSGAAIPFAAFLTPIIIIASRYTLPSKKKIIPTFGINVSAKIITTDKKSSNPWFV